jgi:serine/threonine-protein kinase
LYIFILEFVLRRKLGYNSLVDAEEELSVIPGEILPNGLILERLLNRGGLSAVWLASNNGKPVVVKGFRRDPDWTEDQMQRGYNYFLNEVKYLQQLNHVRLVKGLGTFQIHNELYILLEYIPGTDLRKWMDKHAPPRTLDQFCKIAHTIAEGLRYMHSRGLIHRDIAPRNIMVNDDLTATLIDFQFTCPEPSFGSSEESRAGKPMTYGLGHWAYAAPEVMDGFDVFYDHRADIYSLGAILFELLVGRPPRRRPVQEWRSDVPRHVCECLWAMVDEFPGNRPNWPEIERVLASIL